MTGEELLFWLSVVLVMIELFFILYIGLLVYAGPLGDIAPSLRRKARERYKKIFEDWLKGGNLLFKVKGGGCICYENTEQTALFLAFGSEGDYYSYRYYKHIIGKAMSKNRLNRLPEEYIRRYPLTKDEFVEQLIDADSKNKIHGSFSYPFSFDKIDLNELPDWLVAALVERKLSE